MRILIYGAGVTGSLYAVLLKEAGYYTTIYARGHRLEALQNQGFLYKKNNIIKKVDIKIIDHLQDNDIYDFIFLTVRENQLYQALKELKSNKSKTIITMVNTLDNYEKWDCIVGKGKYYLLSRMLEALSQIIYLMQHLLLKLYNPLLFLKYQERKQKEQNSSHKY